MAGEGRDHGGELSKKTPKSEKKTIRHGENKVSEEGKVVSKETQATNINSRCHPMHFWELFDE